MTNGKKPTLEDIAKMTLDAPSIQKVAGANFAHNNFGEEGKSVYEMYMASKEVKDIREKDYQERKEEYKSRKVVGDPSYLSDGDVTNKILEQIEENRPFVYLGDLEEIVKSIAPNFEFELPEELKKYNYSTLTKIAMEKGAIDEKNGTVDIKRLSKEEQEAFEKYNILVKAYDKACSLNMLNLYSFTELNAIDKAVTEKYHPKEK